MHELREFYDSRDILLKIWYYGKVLMIEDLLWLEEYWPIKRKVLFSVVDN